MRMQESVFGLAKIKCLMRNRGSILAHMMMLVGVLLIIFVFVSVLLFQHVVIGVFHDAKNNLYMVNRNVLLALNREEMGVDRNGFYEERAKKLVEKEIKRLWNIKVGQEQKKGIIQKIEIEEVKIRHDGERMYICSELEISLRPIIFQKALQDKLIFTVAEETKVEKMKG